MEDETKSLGNEESSAMLDIHELLVKAAEAGDSDAMCILGELSEEDGNLDDARAWYMKAAEAGNSDAMVNLGVLSKDAGDLDEARSWYTKVAEAGNSDAMTRLEVLSKEAEKGPDLKIYDKAKVIVEFTKENSNNKEFEEFFAYCDLGVPVAIAFCNDFIELTNEGEDLLKETWIELCSALGADSNADYEDLADLQNSVQSIDLEASIDFNNAGHSALSSGNAEEALDLFEKAAKMGQPNAITSLIWVNILLNDFEAAEMVGSDFNSFPERWRKAFDRATGNPQLGEREFGGWEYQANYNLALASWLKGDYSMTVKLLGFAGDHVEAIFLRNILGGEEPSEMNLTTKQKNELIEIFSGAITDFENIKAKNPEMIKISSGKTLADAARSFIQGLEMNQVNFDPFKNVSAEIMKSILENNSGSIDPWMVQNAIKFSELAIFHDPALTLAPRPIFNVEVAQMFVGTYFPEHCDDCQDLPECLVCGKNKVNHLRIMTANRDADFMPFSISKGSREKEVNVGLYVNFIDQELNPNSVPQLELPPVAPVVLGQLVLDGEGQIYMGDGFAEADGGDFVTSVHMTGTQHVIAWIGYDSDGTLTPLALTTTNQELTALISGDLNLDNEPTEKVQQAIVNSLSGLVAARMGADLEGIAELNYEIVGHWLGEDHPICSGWHMQLACNENSDVFCEEFLESIVDDASCARWTIFIDILRLRGEVSAARTFFSRIIDQKAKYVQEATKQFIALSSATKVGKFLPPDRYNLIYEVAGGKKTRFNKLKPNFLNR